MSLNEFKNLGEPNVIGDKANFIEGTMSDAKKLFNKRVVGEIEIIETPKGLIKMGFDKFGNKIGLRDYSTKGGSYPTIDLYRKDKPKIIIRELKFRK